MRLILMLPHGGMILLSMLFIVVGCLFSSIITRTIIGLAFNAFAGCRYLSDVAVHNISVGVIRSTRLALDLAYLAGRWTFRPVIINFVRIERWVQRKIGMEPSRGDVDPLLEALDVLGLDRQFTRDEFERTFDRLIPRVHPDRGGNKYLAQKVIGARDTIIRSKAWI